MTIYQRVAVLKRTPNSAVWELDETGFNTTKQFTNATSNFVFRWIAHNRPETWVAVQIEVNTFVFYDSTSLGVKIGAPGSVA